MLEVDECLRCRYTVEAAVSHSKHCGQGNEKCTHTAVTKPPIRAAPKVLSNFVGSPGVDMEAIPKPERGSALSNLDLAPGLYQTFI